MKKLFILSISIFTFIALNAQTAIKSTTTPPVKSDKNGAEITFESLVHDYGTVQKGADGNCEFQFTNTGKEPLILSDVKSSCGCTVPSWTKEPVLPGKTGIIKVNYTKTNVVGTISKQITVTSNATTETVVLSIKGTVVDNTPAEVVPVKQTNEVVAPQK
ncbi:MAG: DUF1573 domain-containing protein [Bacteroidetes bacterium]|nr:DUF1573 domain-containing protein [Bacteroidota bacterium]